MITCAIRNEVQRKPDVRILSGVLLLLLPPHAVTFVRGHWKGALRYLVVTPAEGLTFPQSDLC